MIKLKSILLLLVLLAPVTGTYIIFKNRQYQVRKDIKRQIKRGVSESDLVLLKIPKEIEQNPNPSFKRIHSKEFRYNGEMYDIVLQEAKGDTTWYWCIWDKEETALFAKLDELFARAWGKDPVNQSNNEKLFSFLKNLFTPPNFDFNLSLFYPLLKLVLISATSDTCAGFIKLPEPPP